MPPNSSTPAMNVSDHPKPFSQYYFDLLNGYVDPLRSVAKSVNENAINLSLYSLLDGLIISYSVFKLYFDLTCSPDKSSSNELHDWMETSDGCNIILSSTLGIILFSWIGTLLVDKDGNENNEGKNLIERKLKDLSKYTANHTIFKWLSVTWPYARDIFKGLKFSYKGIRSTFQVFVENPRDFQSAINFWGLGMGILAALNRVIYRSMIMDVRKNHLQTNKEVLKKIESLGCHYRFQESNLDHLQDKDHEVLYLELDIDKKVLRCTTSLNKNGPVEIELNDISDKFVDSKNQPIESKNLTIAALEEGYRQNILAALLYGSNRTHASSKIGNSILESSNVTDTREKLKKSLKDQASLPSSEFAMSIAVYSGFVDGLYTYMGILCLAPMTPTVLAAMTACSVVFTLICMINRCHEEYEYQQEFNLTKILAEEALLKKRLDQEFWNAHVKHLSVIKQTSKNVAKDATLFDGMMSASNELRKQKNDILILSPWRASLKGLRSGLYFYSAISSLIFAASMLVTLSQSIILLGISIGILGMLGFVINSYLINAFHLQHRVKTEAKVNSEFATTAKLLSEKINLQNTKPEDIEEYKNAYQNAMHVDPSPQYPIQELSEITRSACSGLGKGSKAVDFIFNNSLIKTATGYQKTIWMRYLGVGLSFLYGASYFWKAFGKQLKEVKKTSPVITPPKTIPPRLPPAITAASINDLSSAAHSNSSASVAPSVHPSPLISSSRDDLAGSLRFDSDSSLPDPAQALMRLIK